MRRFLLFLSLLPAFLFAQENETIPNFRHKGFIDSYHAVRAGGENDYMSSRSRLRIEGGLEKGNTSGFVSLNAVYNPIVERQTGLFLREAFMEYSNNKWTLKAGRQIVTWGVADGLQVTDIISPMDYTEFLAQDYDDIRIPVNAIRLFYGGLNAKIEAIFVPVPELYRLPTEADNPWCIPFNDANCFMNNNVPEKKIKNSEFGSRLSAYLNGFDFSVCALRTWNKMPVFVVRGISPENLLLVESQYGRMTMLGGDLSVSAGKFVIRADVSCYLDALHSPRDFRDFAVKCDDLLSLVGIDWYPGRDWTVMMQYCHTYIFGNKQISDYHNSGMATVNISKALLRNSLKVAAFGRVDCANDGAFFTRFNADYLLTDDVAITLGYDWFRADSGMFVLYRDNSEVWAKMKYSF